MDVKGINAGIITPKKVESKEEQTVKRVQAEFINQLMQGKSEEEAFKTSLKAIDEKYNPKEDSVNLSTKPEMSLEDASCYKAMIGKVNAKSFKLPDGKTVLKWLTFIAEALPILLNIINMIPKTEAPKPTPEAAPEAAVINQAA